MKSMTFVLTMKPLEKNVRMLLLYISIPELRKDWPIKKTAQLTFLYRGAIFLLNFRGQLLQQLGR